ncbi:MAG: hypothetical protein CMJ19_19870 [Phycisphaeraceae bacterium]|nr:hypothetical protein [Phycisphaeraceae bacterium]
MTRFKTCLLGLALVFLTNPLTVHATEVCENPQFEKDLEPWTLIKGDGMDVKYVTIDDLPGTKGGVHANVTKPQPKASYRCGLQQITSMFIPKDAAMKLTFQAKGDPGKQVRFNIQTNGHPWDTTLATPYVKLTNEWKSYTFEGKAKRDYAPGDLRVYALFGLDAGELTITDIHLEVEGAGLAPAGQAINPNATFAHKNSNWWYNSKKMDMKLLKDGSEDYIQFTTKDIDPKKRWEASLSERIYTALPKDSKVKLVAVMRSPTQGAKIDLFLQGKGGHKERLINAAGIKLTDTWETYEFNATMDKDYEPRECTITSLLGYMDQIIEIKSITLSFSE